MKRDISESIDKKDEKNKYVTMRLSDQLFGIRVDSIEDILLPSKITPVPLAPAEIKGAINLRGRIVTVIDLKTKLSLINNKEKVLDDYRSVVIEYKGELYSIMVDKVSEVMNLSKKDIAHNPDNLPDVWRSISDGVYSMDNELMVILNVNKLFNSYNDNNEEQDDE